MNKIVLLKLLGCTLLLSINNISYSSDINTDNSKIESYSSTLHPLQTEYFELNDKFDKLYDKCDKIFHSPSLVKEIWELLKFSNPSNADTLYKLKDACVHCIDSCNERPTYYTKYRKKEMSQQQKDLLQEIKNSCNDLQTFLIKFVQVDAQENFKYYCTELLEMDKEILRVFTKDSSAQIKLHKVILNAMKMNTVLLGDEPRYNFELEIKNILTQILQSNQGTFTDGQVNVIKKLLKLCNNLNNDVKLYIENTSYF